MNYSATIDNLKGLLLLLVIIGHVLLGTLQENPIRYWIYAFHMPLFLFISGYLFKKESVQQLSWVAFFQKYWHRMLKYWCLAFVVYTVISLRSSLTVISFLRSLINPYYHLWYVPSLFIMICLVKGSTRLNLSKSLLWVIAGILFIIGSKGLFPDICRITFFVYFLLGMALRNSLLAEMRPSTMGGGFY